MLLALFVATLLALRATAFLIVPDIAPDLQSTDGKDRSESGRLSFLLKCAECPFPVIADDVQVWEDDSDSWMVSNIINLRFLTSPSILGVVANQSGI